MLIEVENMVIILDEAHNMEDSAREAASLSVNKIQISEVLKEITELCMLNHLFLCTLICACTCTCKGVYI